MVSKRIRSIKKRAFRAGVATALRKTGKYLNKDARKFKLQAKRLNRKRR